MADSAALRQRRRAAHRRGDHALCRPQSCPEAGTVTPATTRGLLAAVEREFAGDSMRLEPARSLVAVAARGGQPAVAAIGRLTDMLEDHRRAPAYDGPITIIDEIR